MKILCEKSDLTAGLVAIKAALSPKTTLPALLNVLAETVDGKLRLASTDLEMAANVMLPVEAEVDGAIAIPAQKLGEIVSSVDGEVSLEVKDGKVIVKAGRSRFSMIGTPKEEYPTLPAFADKGSFSVPGSELAAMVRKVVVAASDDESRHVLNGALWTSDGKTLTLVATDGRRLALTERKVQGIPEFSAIVPRKILQELARQAPENGEIAVAISESAIAFKFGCTVLHSRLIEGSFPQYGQVVPSKSATEIAVSVEAMRAVINRAALCSDTMKWTLASGKITLSAQNASMNFDDELVVEQTGPDMEIAFNPEFVIAALATFDSERVRIGLDSGGKPSLFRPVGDDAHQHVIMPMRI